MVRNPAYDYTETVLILDLYKEIGWRNIRYNDPRIAELAEIITKRRGIPRTYGGIKAKLENFKSIDPDYPGKGRDHRAGMMQDVWDEFYDDPWLHRDAGIVRMAVAGNLDKRISADPMVSRRVSDVMSSPFEPDDRRLTVEKAVEVRIFDGRLRRFVLESFGNRCCVMKGECDPGLLEACHIIPFRNPDHTVNAYAQTPGNILCMNPFHHAAFDRGLFTVDKNHRIVLSDRLSGFDVSVRRRMFDDFAGTEILLPKSYNLCSEALKYHREHIFKGSACRA